MSVKKPPLVIAAWQALNRHSKSSHSFSFLVFSLLGRKLLLLFITYTHARISNLAYTARASIFMMSCMISCHKDNADGPLNFDFLNFEVRLRFLPVQFSGEIMRIAYMYKQYGVATVK